LIFPGVRSVDSLFRAVLPFFRTAFDNVFSNLQKGRHEPKSISNEETVRALIYHVEQAIKQ
jgi:hypothetical protein